MGSVHKTLQMHTSSQVVAFVPEKDGQSHHDYSNLGIWQIFSEKTEQSKNVTARKTITVFLSFMTVKLSSKN